ncbi:MAG: hypothetical protein DHS20C21_21630 [Gemmatimonadota bacterium]|nr:MAG: hypothetical protein DHS20C21_21630 [Gemmatimonadota bacterium]
MYPALIGNIGTMEIVVILFIALLLFGRRLPEVGRSLGKGIVEFKKGIKGIEDDIRDDIDRSDRDIERIPQSRHSAGPVDMSDAKTEKEEERSQPGNGPADAQQFAPS